MKCKECGEEFSRIQARDLIFSNITNRGARGYHPCSRLVLKKQRNWAFYISVSDKGDFSPKSNTVHPICPACFLKKLKRAVVALENALENKGIDPDDETEDIPEEQPKKTKIVVPSAEEIKRDYPEWVARVTKAHHGVPLEGESLRDVFRMQRRSGCV